jgi:hypothetical protein
MGLMRLSVGWAGWNKMERLPMNHPDLGWTDPVGRLVRLQTAVRTLAEGRGKTADRLEKATYALVGMPGVADLVSHLPFVRLRKP